MEIYFTEYVGKKVRVHTSKGIVEGILEEGVRTLINGYILFPNDYAYSVKIDGVWYEIHGDGIMLLLEE